MADDKSEDASMEVDVDGEEGGEADAEEEEEGEGFGEDTGALVALHRPEHVLKAVFESETPADGGPLYHIDSERDSNGMPISAREAALYLWERVGHLWTSVCLGREKYVVYVCKPGGNKWGHDVDGWLQAFYPVLSYTVKKKCDDAEVVKYLLNDAAKLSQLKALLKCFNQVSHAEWVARTDVVPRFMYPCKDGMLDMLNMTTRRYTWRDLLTGETIDTSLPITKGMMEEAKVLELEAYIAARMNEIFPEENLRLCVLGRVAYCFLTGDPMKFRQFVILQGAGSNGKSAFMELYASLFPQLVVAFAGSTDTPVAQKRVSDTSAPNSNAMKMKGKRLILTKDFPSELVNAGMIKNLAGDYNFMARDLHEKATQITVVGLMVFGTNSPLRFAHYDEALMNRLLAYDMPSKFCNMSDLKQAAMAEDPEQPLHFPADEEWDRRFNEDTRASKLALIRYTAAIYKAFLPHIGKPLESQYDARPAYLDMYESAKLAADMNEKREQHEQEQRELSFRAASESDADLLKKWLEKNTAAANKGEKVLLETVWKALGDRGCPKAVRGASKNKFTALATPWLEEKGYKLTRGKNIPIAHGVCIIEAPGQHYV